MNDFRRSGLSRNVKIIEEDACCTLPHVFGARLVVSLKYRVEKVREEQNSTAPAPPPTMVTIYVLTGGTEEIIKARFNGWYALILRARCFALRCCAGDGNGWPATERYRVSLTTRRRR